ncbi:MAG: prolyl oligopeptidase family serine peptidase [Anaerolineae bacterium]
MKRTRRYWLRLIILAVVGVAAGVFLPPLLIGVAMLWGLTHPACNPGGTPAQFGMNYEDISFPSTRGVTQEGYFIPGTNGATVIIPPAFGNGRGGDLHYAAVFNGAGFNVITFDGRVCTSYGHTSMGYVEVEDVEAAYAYLQTRPDVDATRVTLHGFSSAGATSLMAAARMPAIRGVSAEGNYVDIPHALGMDQPQTFLYSLTYWSASLTYRLVTGEDISVLSPIKAMATIGARPVLLIYGTLDGAYADAPSLRDAAEAGGAAVELWIVEGARHGEYMAVAGAEFDQRVITFHCEALGGRLELTPIPRCL